MQALLNNPTDKENSKQSQLTSIEKEVFFRMLVPVSDFHSWVISTFRDTVERYAVAAERQRALPVMNVERRVVYSFLAPPLVIPSFDQPRHEKHPWDLPESEMVRLKDNAMAAVTELKDKLKFIQKTELGAHVDSEISYIYEVLAAPQSAGLDNVRIILDRTIAASEDLLKTAKECVTKTNHYTKGVADLTAAKATRKFVEPLTPPSIRLPAPPSLKDIVFDVVTRLQTPNSIVHDYELSFDRDALQAACLALVNEAKITPSESTQLQELVACSGISIEAHLKKNKDNPVFLGELTSFAEGHPELLSKNIFNAWQCIAQACRDSAVAASFVKKNPGVVEVYSNHPAQFRAVIRGIVRHMAQQPDFALATKSTEELL